MTWPSISLQVWTMILAALLAAQSIEIFRTIALRFGIVDHPDGRLKKHQEPIPYMGGMAIYTAFLLTLAIVSPLDQRLLALTLAGTLMLIVGLIDDLGSLSPIQKLFGQAVAIVVLMRSGVHVEIVGMPAWLAWPISFFWLLVTTNALNIIDIMDGLAVAISTVIFFFLFIVALLNGDLQLCLIILALLGTLPVFYTWNRIPAKIYLGDSGSLFLGLMMGAIAMLESFSRPGHYLALLAPAVILAVPLFDLAFVSYIRYRRGIPIFLGSPDHFALRLRNWRLSLPQTVWVSAMVSILCGITGLAIMIFSDRISIWILLSFALSLIVIVMWLQKKPLPG